MLKAAVSAFNCISSAVAAKPVINWLSKPLTADSMVGQIYHQFPGPPWEHLEHGLPHSSEGRALSVTGPGALARPRVAAAGGQHAPHLAGAIRRVLRARQMARRKGVVARYDCCHIDWVGCCCRQRNFDVVLEAAVVVPGTL